MKFSIILKYLQAFGWPWVCLIVATYLGQNLVSIGQNLWLSAWAKEAKHMNDFTEWKQIRSHKLNIYGLLGLIQGKKMSSCFCLSLFILNQLIQTQAYGIMISKINTIIFKYLEITKMHIFPICHIWESIPSLLVSATWPTIITCIFISFGPGSNYLERYHCHHCWGTLRLIY